MGLDNVGDNELTGVSASGTAPDIRSEGSTPGGGSSSNKPGIDSAGSGKQMSGQSAGNALSQGLSGAGRVGFGMLALGRNGANATMAMFNTMLRKVAAAATTGGAAVSSFTGGAVSEGAGTGIVAGGGVISTVATLGMVAYTLAPPVDPGVLGSSVQQCNVSAADMSIGEAALVDGDMEQDAKNIYGILSGLGMPDENIAGILGNFETESGFDPTAVEGVPITGPEYHRIGEQKKAAEKNNFEGLGIGVGQWTAERNVALRKYAEEKGGDWYDLRIQMAFMISDDSGAEIVRDMIEGTSPGSDNPKAASRYFLQEWERPLDHATGGPNDIARGESASKWFAKMGGWSADNDAADSVLALADTEVKGANSKSVQQQMVSCESGLGSNSGGNSDIAEAFATYAWPVYDMGANNDGTYQYVWLHDEIFGGNQYASCDNGVATAVRWSGTDDSFPQQSSNMQYDYAMTEKEKWEELTGWDQSSTEGLEPGDVLITYGHIGVYLGEEAVEKVWGDTEYADDVAGIDYGQASCNDHAPGLQEYWLQGDSRQYKAFRSRKTEESSEFTDLNPPSDLRPATGPDQFTTPGC